MTYFLEKYYEVGHDGKLHPIMYSTALVRPCSWDYKKVLDFLNGKLRKTTSLLLEGAVAHYSTSSISNEYWRQDAKMFSSIEEWLIWLDLEKGITPDFEEVHIQSANRIHDYIAKTTDLRTKEVLYDNVDGIIMKIRAQDDIDAKMNMHISI